MKKGNMCVELMRIKHIKEINRRMSNVIFAFSLAVVFYWSGCTTLISEKTANTLNKFYEYVCNKLLK
jgi:hypothetical protein